MNFNQNIFNKSIEKIRLNLLKQAICNSNYISYYQKNICINYLDMLSTAKDINDALNLILNAM
mgnify:CR=1 FL=1